MNSVFLTSSDPSAEPDLCHFWGHFSKLCVLQPEDISCYFCKDISTPHFKLRRAISTLVSEAKTSRRSWCRATKSWKCTGQKGTQHRLCVLFLVVREQVACSHHSGLTGWSWVLSLSFTAPPMGVPQQKHKLNQISLVRVNTSGWLVWRFSLRTSSWYKPHLVFLYCHVGQVFHLLHCF